MKELIKKTMKVTGHIALLLGALVVVPNSTFFSYQPKCPDELLK